MFLDVIHESDKVLANLRTKGITVEMSANQFEGLVNRVFHASRIAENSTASAIAAVTIAELGAHAMKRGYTFNFVNSTDSFTIKQ